LGGAQSRGVLRHFCGNFIPGKDVSEGGGNIRRKSGGLVEENLNKMPQKKQTTFVKKTGNISFGHGGVGYLQSKGMKRFTWKEREGG